MPEGENMVESHQEGHLTGQNKWERIEEGYVEREQKMKENYRNAPEEVKREVFNLSGPNIQIKYVDAKIYKGTSDLSINAKLEGGNSIGVIDYKDGDVDISWQGRTHELFIPGKNEMLINEQDKIIEIKPIQSLEDEKAEQSKEKEKTITLSLNHYQVIHILNGLLNERKQLEVSLNSKERFKRLDPYKQKQIEEIMKVHESITKQFA